MFVVMAQNPSHIVAPILAELRTVRSPQSKIEIYLKACREIQYQFPEDAFELATKARKVARAAKATALELHAQRMQGICRYAGNDFDGALTIFEQTLGRYRRAGDRTGLAKAYQNIGMALRGLGRNEEALAAYREAEGLLRNLPEPAILAAVLTNLGSLWAVLDRPKEALEAYSECLTLAERLDDDRWRARITGNIADIYSKIGDLETAVDWSHRSLALHRKTNDRMGIGLTLSNLGRVYQRLQQPDKALAVLSEAVTVMTTLGDTHARARVMVVLAGVLRHKQRLPEARTMALEALTVFEGTHDVERTIGCLLVIGECDLDDGRTSDASRRFAMAEELAQRTDNPRVMLDIRHGQARVEQARGRWKVARTALMKAIEIAHAHEMFAVESTLHTRLAELLEERGAVSEALVAERLARQAQHLADSALRAQHSLALQMRLDIERAARERERLQSEQDRLRFELESKAREVNNNAVLIAQKNQLLTDLTTDLKQTLKVSDKERAAAIRTLISRIDQHRRTGEDWKNLSEQLKDVHDDFLAALSERFPSLTPTEIKVCSLLKLNLSSKEISEILTIGLPSVEQYRHRLRKKLGLSLATNLTTFLQGLGT